MIKPYYRDPGDHYLATPGNPAYVDLIYPAADVSWAFAGLTIDWEYPATSGPLNPSLRAYITVEWSDDMGSTVLVTRHSTMLTFDNYN